MVAVVRGLVAGRGVVFWAFATWLIPALVAAGWWRHRVHGVPLRCESSPWSVVFPLGMYAVAGIHLGRADDLPIVVLVGAAWLWVVLSAWAAVFTAMLVHLARRLVLGRRIPAPAWPERAGQAVSARSRSSSWSSTSSMPTESRTRSTGTASAVPLTEACVISEG